MNSSPAWPTYDLASAVLMDGLHERWQDGGLPLADALHGSVRWARTATRHELRERLLSVKLADAAEPLRRLDLFGGDHPPDGPDATLPFAVYVP